MTLPECFFRLKVDDMRVIVFEDESGLWVWKLYWPDGGFSEGGEVWTERKAKHLAVTEYRCQTKKWFKPAKRAVWICVRRENR